MRLTPSGVTRSGGRPAWPGPRSAPISQRQPGGAVHGVRLDVEVLGHLLDQHLVQQVGQVLVAAASPGPPAAGGRARSGPATASRPGRRRPAPAGPAAPRCRPAPPAPRPPRPGRSRRPRARRPRPGRARPARSPSAARSAPARRAPARRTSRPGCGRPGCWPGRSTRAARGHGGRAGAANAGGPGERWSPERSYDPRPGLVRRPPRSTRVITVSASLPVRTSRSSRVAVRGAGVGAISSTTC